MEYTIHLTDKCNLNCKYCYENKKNMDISFENIKRIIDYEIKQKNKYAQIIFYGGEPLVREDLFEVMNYAHNELGFKWGITTNGLLIDVWKNKFEWFRNLDKFKIGACATCEDWKYCRGDPLHTWDFENNKLKLCINKLIK